MTIIAIANPRALNQAFANLAIGQGANAPAGMSQSAIQHRAASWAEKHNPDFRIFTVKIAAPLGGSAILIERLPDGAASSPAFIEHRRFRRRMAKLEAIGRAAFFRPLERHELEALKRAHRDFQHDHHHRREELNHAA